MGFSEAEISPQGARGANADVCNFRLHFGKNRQFFLDQSGPFDGSKSYGTANEEHGIFRFDSVQARNCLHVDQMLITQKIMLHREQQFRPARIQACLLSELREHLGCFGGVFGLMNGETSQGHHNDLDFGFSNLDCSEERVRNSRSSILDPPSSIFYSGGRATRAPACAAPGECGPRWRGLQRWRCSPPSNSARPRRRLWRHKDRRRLGSAPDVVQLSLANRKTVASDNPGSNR